MPTQTKQSGRGRPSFFGDLPTSRLECTLPQACIDQLNKLEDRTGVPRARIVAKILADHFGGETRPRRL